MCEAAQQAAWWAEAKGGPGSDLWLGQGRGTQEGRAGRGGGGARVRLRGRVREHHSRLAPPLYGQSPTTAQDRHPGAPSAGHMGSAKEEKAKTEAERPARGTARRRPSRPLALAGERLDHLGCVHSAAGQRPGPARGRGPHSQRHGAPASTAGHAGEAGLGWGTRIADPHAGHGRQGGFRGRAHTTASACAQSPGLHPGASLQAWGPEQLHPRAPPVRLGSPWPQHPTHGSTTRLALGSPQTLCSPPGAGEESSRSGEPRPRSRDEASKPSGARAVLAVLLTAEAAAVGSEADHVRGAC